jgi:hypothetical protein
LSLTTVPGLDHRVGHFVSLTAPDTEWLNIVKSCNKKATSPSFAIEFHRDSGFSKGR